MKKLFPYFIFGFATILLASCIKISNNNSSLSGRVVDSLSGKGLKDVDVTLEVYSRSGWSAKSTVAGSKTDKNGDFSMDFKCRCNYYWQQLYRECQQKSRLHGFCILFRLGNFC